MEYMVLTSDLIGSPIEASLHSRMNLSRTAHRISTKFKLSILDFGRYAQSLSFIADDVEKGKILFSVSGSLNTPIFVWPCTRVE